MDRAALDSLVRQYAAGTILFEEGDPGGRMYVIRTGRVKIFKRIGGAEVTLAILGNGDFFGEMSVLDGMPRSAGSMVIENASLLEVDGSTFESLVRNNGEVAVRLLRKLAGRLREADKQIESLFARTGSHRAVDALRAASATDAQGRRVVAALSRENFAAAITLPVDEADRIFSRLVRAGLVVEQAGKLFLAPEPLLLEYLLYLDLQQKYDPFTTRQMAELAGLPEEEAEKIVRRLIESSAASVKQGDLADGYQTYLALKRRFEYRSVKAINS